MFPKFLALSLKNEHRIDCARRMTGLPLSKVFNYRADESRLTGVQIAPLSQHSRKDFKSTFIYFLFPAMPRETGSHSIYDNSTARNQVSSTFHSISINRRKFQGRRPCFHRLLIAFASILRLAGAYNFLPSSRLTSPRENLDFFFRDFINRRGFKLKTFRRIIEARKIKLCA